MVTLGQPSVAGEIQQERAERKQAEHQRLVKHNFHFRQDLMETALSDLLKLEKEEGESHEEDVTGGNEPEKGAPVPPVFRGYR